MGGGGAMRAAAKVAGIGVFNGGIRGVSADHTPLSSIGRSRKVSTRPVSAIVSSSNDLNSDDLIPSRNENVGTSLPKACFGIDDWEFAGEEEIEDLVINSVSEPTPRLVFGVAPSLQETHEATTELKDALERVYLLSPTSTVSTGSYGTGQRASLQSFPHSEVPDAKTWIASESMVAPPMPKHAIQAFKLLSESPAAQNVVSSIASDPNVWDAVLKNEAIVEFLNLQTTSADESVADIDCLSQQLPKSVDESTSSGGSVSGNGFVDFVLNVKFKVINMMSSLSGFFQNLFGDLTTEKSSASDDRSAKINLMGGPVGASFMALAIMVIMVVVLKRGEATYQ